MNCFKFSFLFFFEQEHHDQNLKLIFDRMSTMETVGVNQTFKLVYIAITCDPDGIIQIRL